PDSILLGEVWEDASNKIAYSERKNYFEGDKLDSVMNYPFRVGIISFVRYGDAYSLAEAVERIVENYPPEVTACLMNMLGTHDTERILTALGGKDFGSDPPRDVVAGVKMTPEERERAVRLLKIASVLQMTLPGVPCVYYGDEAGTEGYKDPFNRTCFPWGNEDPDIMNWYRNIIRIRRSHAVYKTGRYRTAACVGGLYAFERYADGERMVTAANCGEKEELLLLAGCWRDLLTGREFRDNITLFPQEVLLLEEIK
ncbi:MAG: glycoside hydrolase family 13 protein, partial [Eubacterium sp.]|nr:glycoside hydrolase family 13 protein [Eubacterium sp.]